VPRPIATFALALTLPLLYPGALRAQSSIAITGATLLDGTGAAPVTDAAVIVRDGRIVALDADPLADPRNYQRVRWVMKGGALIPRPR
jgi:imidazolonepropionase-like amidohydrolase